jgi:hypothetical protein
VSDGGTVLVTVPTEEMTAAELLAEAERQRTAGDLLHATELEFYAAHFAGKPFPTQKRWKEALAKALARHDPAALRLLDLNSREPKGSQS